MASKNKILYMRQNSGKYNKKELAAARVRGLQNNDDSEPVENYSGTVASGFVGNFADVLLPDNSRVSVQLSKTAPTVPVIGDRVILDENNSIEKVLPRHSYLARMRTIRGRTGGTEHIIAANIDVVVIVSTAAQPAFSSEFIDRYLVLCEYGNVKPLIVLNKSDLTDERNPILDWYKKIGITVIETSATTLRGVDKLRAAISGNTVVFVGKSGVGKSSLINALYPDANIKTSEFSTVANQGQHTTVLSNLYVLDRDTYLIDTPGIRRLELSGISPADLSHYFPEIKKLGADCKYADCTHSHEDGCAVKPAVDSGEIPRVRFESYLRMLNGIPETD